MNKHNNQRNEGGPTPFDDSWWAAVLAEEEEHGGFPSGRPGSSSDAKTNLSHPAQKPAPVDWNRAQAVYERDETICLKVFGYNRGGLLVEGEGLQGFVPLSHLVDLAGEKADADQGAMLAPLLSAYVGRLLRLKVIECEPERGRVVFSERAALAEPGRRNQLLDNLRPGDCVRGVVTNITDFGVFVDLGGVEGLIHVSELSWGRVRHPGDAAELGDEVGAYVINVEKDRSRVALSLKRLRPNPWDSAEERYKPGQVIEAVITSVVPFGAFARLEEGLDGLIHISEMGLLGKKAAPSDVLVEGQRVQVRVLQVDASKQRLGLSLVPTP
ncbi:MAG: S1 RNA-binding domain-containing protein [Chloroflexota bacterium]|nr:MAG: S1 RNA-binding domain-containing protein [Chloroflexota bacterium]